MVDPTPERRAVAEALGLSRSTRRRRTCRRAAQGAAGGTGPRDRGADVVFQCRGQAARAGHRAARACARRARSSTWPSTRAAPDEVRLGEEFHHNGLAMRCAQIGRVPRGLAPPWDRERLSAETIDLLRAHGDGDPQAAGHRRSCRFDDAPALLADLAARRRHALLAVLDLEGGAV